MKKIMIGVEEYLTLLNEATCNIVCSQGNTIDSTDYLLKERKLAEQPKFWIAKNGRTSESRF